MMSFTANGNYTETEIPNNGFFPSINTSDFRKTQKQDGTLSDDRVVFALTLAIADANRILASWQTRQTLAGYSRLATVPADTVNNESVKVTKYRLAVFSFAKAYLIEKFRDFDTTNTGDRQADRMESAIDSHRRDASWAIADIQGEPRTIVELI